MDVKREEHINRDGKPEIAISSTKLKTKFHIVKTNDGFSHFEVKVEKGKLPKELDTRFTGLYKAAEAVEEYLRKHKGSQTVARDKFGDKYEARKKNDAAVSPTDN